MESANRGAEVYSAWFGDSDGEILYFGLSPFWQLWWQSAGDPRADLAEAGDHLIGRFDLRQERFLPPLVVRQMGPNVRSSVWDVLVHSNGRIYYTTCFEEMGSVGPDGSDLHHFEGVGVGFNELIEGPNGNLYVTRYSDAPEDAEKQRYGAIVELTPAGELVRELRFEKADGVFTAPKSLAVDPTNGEIWANTDTFLAGGRVVHETLHLSAEGKLLSRRPAPPELHFVHFDSAGRGFFAEDVNGELRVRIRAQGRELANIPLGRREYLDFVQDIHTDPDGTTAVSFWSGRVVLLIPGDEGWVPVATRLRPPPACRSPQGRSLQYTAVTYAGKVFATLFCGPTVLGRAWR